MTTKLKLGDLQAGAKFETAGLVVTEAHIVAFAGIGGDFFGLHMDDIYAREQGFPGRVAHGLLGLALVDGLKNRAETQVDAIASLEWQYRFLAPVFVGDRIQARMRVLDFRRTSDQRRGVARLAFEVANQHGTVVQQGVNTLLVHG
jgi:3-hydroxybutyryl-CoA dehydratase